LPKVTRVIFTQNVELPPASTNPAVTRNHVARAAGVSTGTVSKALSGKGSVRPATREKVLRAAAELGYRHNQAAALLARQRRSAANNPGLSLAYLTAKGSDKAAFCRIAEKAGASGQVFNASEFENPQSMLNVLWHRGIQGILVDFEFFPWSEAEIRECDWSKLSVVKIKRAYQSLKFHLIRHSAFDYMRETLVRVMNRGYRRIAVLFIPTASEVDDDARYGAVAALGNRFKEQGVRIQYWITPSSHHFDHDPGALRWLRERKPDAIVAFLGTSVYPLYEAGWRFPEHTGFAAVMRPHEKPPSELGIPAISGCEPNATSILARGVDALKEVIGRGESGFPSLATEFVVEPEWVDGQTLPVKSSSSTLRAGKSCKGKHTANHKCVKEGI